MVFVLFDLTYVYLERVKIIQDANMLIICGY
jgi:hypothetical protein